MSCLDTEKDLERGLDVQVTSTTNNTCASSPTDSSTTRVGWQQGDGKSTDSVIPQTRVQSNEIERSPCFSLSWLKWRKREDEPHRQPRITPVHGGVLGYPLLARFLNSDDTNYMTYRRFGHVQTRLLLDAQDDLRQLEEKLQFLDSDETENSPKALFTRESISGARKSLMKDLKNAFCEYASLISAAQTLTSLNRPTSAEYTSVENFINNEKPVMEEEYDFVYHKEDLVTLRPGREHAWLDSQVEKLLKLFDGWLIKKLFTTSETAQKKGPPEAVEVYFSRERIEVFVNIIITLMILVLLVIPVYVLYQLTSGDDTPRTNALCMGVLLIFTLTFSACLSFFTRAKRHEILAAAAGYSAVLVVFIGNVSGRGVGH